jgi:hypothetical protein
VQGGFESDADVQAGDAVELGLNYSNKFGDLGVIASFTFYTESLEDGASLPTQVDRDSYAVGAGITYKGLQLGANYMYTDNYAPAGYTSVGVDGADLNQYVVGVQYATGPWSFGINAGYGQAEYDGGRQDELLALLGGVGYNVPPASTSIPRSSITTGIVRAAASSPMTRAAALRRLCSSAPPCRSDLRTRPKSEGAALVVAPFDFVLTTFGQLAPFPAPSHNPRQSDRRIAGGTA